MTEASTPPSLAFDVSPDTLHPVVASFLQGPVFEKFRADLADARLKLEDSERLLSECRSSASAAKREAERMHSLNSALEDRLNSALAEAASAKDLLNVMSNRVDSLEAGRMQGLQTMRLESTQVLRTFSFAAEALELRVQEVVNAKIRTVDEQLTSMATTIFAADVVNAELRDALQQVNTVHLRLTAKFHATESELTKRISELEARLRMQREEHAREVVAARMKSNEALITAEERAAELAERLREIGAAGPCDSVNFRRG